MTAERRPAFLFYVGDWLASSSVNAMPLAAQGLYVRLLAFAWRSDGLPIDEEALRRLVGVARAEWRRLWPHVRPMWREENGRLFNDKLEAVRQESADFTEAARAAGQASARARLAKYGTAQPGANRERTSERFANGSANGSGFRSANGSPNAAEPSSSSSSSNDDDPTVRGAVGCPGEPVQVPAVTSSSSPGGQSPQGWRVPAMELVEDWNQHGPGDVRVEFGALSPATQRLLRDALARRGLDAWQAIFRRAVKSDSLAGRLNRPPVTLWKCIELADRIEGGDFDTWERHTTPEEPARPAYRRWTAEDAAKLRESQRLAAEELAARKARGELPLSEQLRRRRAAPRAATEAADTAHRDLSPLREAERQEAASEHIPPKERAS